MNKTLNTKLNTFYNIRNYSQKQTKIKKYELSEVDSNEAIDSEIIVKKKELDTLTRKYNRLIS